MIIRKLRNTLFGISLKEIRCARRGFEVGNPGVRERIERIGETFVEGYHAALLEDDPGRLGQQLNCIALELRGFAFEGAAMGLALLDFLTPWRRNRWQEFRKGPGAAH
ncbi:MAG: DUF1702 family protein, partial [Candidatus Entotheonellia bacterium]